LVELFSHLLLVGLGAAISPVAAAICFSLLGTSKPLANALAFALGYGVVLAVIAIGAFAFFGDRPELGAGHHSDIRNTLDAAIGVLLVMFALKALLHAPNPNAPPPKWVAAVSSIAPSRAVLLGMVLVLTNPTTLALYVSGLKEVVTVSLGAVEDAVALLVFILLVEVEFLVPITAYAVKPRQTLALMEAIHKLLERHGRSIEIVVLSFLGVLLLHKGLAGLL
jgi:threonine/homoserine/homoserine lactone efflux protein